MPDSSVLDSGDVCDGCALAPPENLTASVDRADEVALTWTARESEAYRVYRCERVPCEWTALGTVEGGAYFDTQVEVPGAPPVPSDVLASGDRATEVRISWTSVANTTARRYGYRVVSVRGLDESVPSEEVEGAVAERPVAGYEVSVDGGAWIAASASPWDDSDAEAATLSRPEVSASQGTYAEYVRIGATGIGSTPGAERSYRVRALTAYAAGPASLAREGRRVAGVLALRWERSTGSEADGFVTLPEADDATFDDAGAPADGGVRWYRLVVSAEGAPTVTSEARAGARKPPPDVAANVTASNDRSDRVTISWSAVDGALAYHVYRGATRLTGATGVLTTTFDDFAADPPPAPWTAPQQASASHDQVEAVALGWTAPTRPVGAAAVYHVRAINQAGEGPASADASGRRAEPALTGWEVEREGVWVETDSLDDMWLDEAAPAGTITPGTVSVSAGELHAKVELAAVGTSSAPGAIVRYRVRGVLADGTRTPESEVVEGQRAVGSLTLRWQRSPEATTGFVDLDLEGVSVADVDAPSDGSKRWYRVDVSGAGAEAALSESAPGWRLAFVDIDGGAGFTCALATDGELWCWGENEHGELGLGTDDDDLHPPTRVPRPAGVDGFERLSVGGNQVCGISTAGDLWCWGRRNGAAEVGVPPVFNATPSRVEGLDGRTVGVVTGTQHACALSENGGVRCWGLSGRLGAGASEDTQTPTPVLTQPGVELGLVDAIWAGPFHSCARRRLSGGSVCWGSNVYGQLGNGSSSVAAYAVNVNGGALAAVPGSSHTCGIEFLGAMTCWGSNNYGELGTGNTTPSSSPVPVVGLPSAASRLTMLNGSSCVVSSSTVWCWGSDSRGQLGNDAPKANSTSPVSVALAGNIMALDAGLEHVCAIVDHAAWCWGANDSGQIDDGASDKLVPSLVPLP